MAGRALREVARSVVVAHRVLGRVVAVTGANDYSVQVPSHTDRAGNLVPYVHLRSTSRVKHYVGDVVVVEYHRGSPQLPYILDAPGAVDAQRKKLGMVGWPTVGCDGRRSQATDTESSLPPSIVGGTTPDVDADWHPAAGVPIWMDDATGEIDASSEWALHDGTVVDLPENYAGGQSAYVHSGVVYGPVGGKLWAWGVSTQEVIWTSPDDADGIHGWSGVVVSLDGTSVYSYAEQSSWNGTLGMWEQILWVRAQSTQTGEILWRTQVTASRYIGGGNTSGLVYDGTRLYCRYAATAAEDAISSVDFSSLPEGFTGAQYNAGRLLEVHVAAVLASDGVLQWDTTVSVASRNHMSPLMMVGDCVAFSYPEITLPSGLTIHADLVAGSYVTQQSHTTIYYPRMVLWRLTGLQVVWRLARLDSSGGLAESTILLEEYDCTNGTGVASPIPATGTDPTRLGSLLTGLWPALVAASRDGSITMYVRNMDDQGTTRTYSQAVLTTLEQAYPDYWTSGRDEWGGPPYAPVWSAVTRTITTPYSVWMGSQGDIMPAEEFVPPDPGTAPYLRYYTYGGAVFGGESKGMAIRQENGSPTGTVTRLAGITDTGMEEYSAVPDLASFHGMIISEGHAYTFDGSHLRRFT